MDDFTPHTITESVALVATHFDESLNVTEEEVIPAFLLRVIYNYLIFIISFLKFKY